VVIIESENSNFGFFFFFFWVWESKEGFVDGSGCATVPCSFCMRSPLCRLIST
jgi:hypothetical protein